MKIKMLSFFIGVFFGLFLCLIYFFGFHNKNIVNSNNIQKNIGNVGFGSGNNAEMNEQMLERMSQRTGISIDELKKEINSGKDIRIIMQEKGIEGGFGSNNGNGRGKQYSQ